MKLKFILLLVSILIVFSCEDNPADSSDNHHFEAIGLYVIDSGDTIVQYIGGTVSGGFEVEEGEDTALLSVKFLDEDGDVGIPDGEEYDFVWTIADTTIAAVESHGEELAEFKFHLQGKAAGNTTITIGINHNDHKDFESKAIPLTVTASN